MSTAIISTFDKTGLADLGLALVEHGYDIISSGGTAAHLESNGIRVRTVGSFTGAGEMLGGRVKTLHPAIHAGILAGADQLSEVEELIDLVVVNLYPFETVTARSDVGIEEALDNIDIGGPAMLRAAAKNHSRVTVLCEPSQYPAFIEGLRLGGPSPQQRQDYALAAFRRTCAYDRAISDFLAGTSPGYGDSQEVSLSLVQELRYGENPHQSAALHRISGESVGWTGIDGIRQLGGKEMSYNNWLDLDLAWCLISDQEEDIPACAIIKHGTPCGMAIGESTAEAYEYALETDPASAFGGIVACNTTLDLTAAEKMRDVFLEILAAPQFTPEALEYLRQHKKNLRVLSLPTVPPIANYSSYRSILGDGMLVQAADRELLDRDKLDVVTETQPAQEDWLELLLAWRVVKHMRSNAIALVNGNRTVGLGAGQTSRVQSVQIALQQATDLATGAVMASDAFFPFPDSVEMAAQSRVKAIIQPGGSIRDQEVIDAANRFHIAMVMTGVRHFRH